MGTAGQTQERGVGTTSNHCGGTCSPHRGEDERFVLRRGRQSLAWGCRASLQARLHPQGKRQEESALRASGRGDGFAQVTARTRPSAWECPPPGCRTEGGQTLRSCTWRELGRSRGRAGRGRKRGKGGRLRPEDAGRQCPPPARTDSWNPMPGVRNATAETTLRCRGDGEAEGILQKERKRKGGEDRKRPDGAASGGQFRGVRSPRRRRGGGGGGAGAEGLQGLHWRQALPRGATAASTGATTVRGGTEGLASPRRRSRAAPEDPGHHVLGQGSLWGRKDPPKALGTDLPRPL